MANGIKEEINIVQSWANRVNNLATQALRQQEKKVYENALLQIKGEHI